MAIASTPTILSLDRYAEIMAIPGWMLAQGIHPDRPMGGDCPNVWYQSGYASTPNRIVQREELAKAIETAEVAIAEYLGFWPRPVWIAAEEKEWPGNSKRHKISNPTFFTEWGQLIEFGVETWELQESLYPVNVVYSDKDSDGYNEWATITFATTLTDPCEIEVVPYGKDPTDREWRIRPLDIEISGGTCTIQGWSWLFFNPDRWLTLDELAVGNASDLLSVVDIYRHYNDPSTQGQLVWKSDLEECTGTTAICTETCQSACGVVDSVRVGKFHLRAASYSGGTWTGTDLSYGDYPDAARVWYRAGYRSHRGYNCHRWPPRLDVAIARLANVYLPEAPCGCGYTRERWEEDRTEEDVVTADIAVAKAVFGTTAKGAVFARSVAASLSPIGQGG